jgi:hypothetical protein
MCRDDVALRDLVVNWHRLSLSVRGAILYLAQFALEEESDSERTLAE